MGHSVSLWEQVDLWPIRTQLPLQQSLTLQHVEWVHAALQRTDISLYEAQLLENEP